jgi:hypothetical protein
MDIVNEKFKVLILMNNAEYSKKEILKINIVLLYGTKKELF